MPRALLICVTTLCAGYLAICALVYAVQDTLVFYPRAAAESAPLTPWRRDFEAADGPLRGWVIPAEAPGDAPLAFYFGGNGEDVSATALAMTDLGLPATMVVVPYRGYGENAGVTSEAALFRDAVEIHDQASSALPHDGRRLVIGRSLGSGVAVHLAAERGLDGAVLVTPFDSVARVAAERFPWLPVSLLLRHRFDSLALAPNLDIPALFVIAERDRVIPLMHSEALRRAWKGRVTRLLVPGVGHNDVSRDPGYWTALAEFMARSGDREAEQAVSY